MRMSNFLAVVLARDHLLTNQWTLLSVLQGVNFSLAGTGGPECVAFIPFWQKIVETLIALSISFSFTYVAGKRLTIDVPHKAYGMSPPIYCVGNPQTGCGSAPTGSNHLPVDGCHVISQQQEGSPTITGLLLNLSVSVPSPVSAMKLI